MNKFINLFLDISPSLSVVHYGFLPRTSCLNGLFMENEYIHIIFDDHKLHALLSLGTRYALDHTQSFCVGEPCYNPVARLLHQGYINCGIETATAFLS